MERSRWLALSVSAALVGCSCHGAPPQAALAPPRPGLPVIESAIWPGSPPMSFGGPSISGDGRIVVFGTDGQLEGTGDVDQVEDVYAYDFDTHTFGLISTTRSVSSGTKVSTDASSADGRFVAYAEQTFVDGERPTTSVLVHDRRSASTTVVWSDHDVQLAEIEPPVISGDGRVIAWSFGALSATESVLVAEVAQPAQEIWRAGAVPTLAFVLGVSSDGAYVAYETGQDVSSLIFWVAERSAPAAQRRTARPIAFAREGLLSVETTTRVVSRGTIDDVLRSSARASQGRAVWVASRSGESVAVLENGGLTTLRGTVVRALASPEPMSWRRLSIADDGRLAGYAELSGGGCVVVFAPDLIPLSCATVPH